MTTAQPVSGHEQTPGAAGGQGKGPMEKVIDGVATGMGNGITFMADHYILFVVFGLLWAAFAVALVTSQGTIDDAWQWIRSLNIVLQAVLWVLFLPVVAGMWVWETTWPLALRLVLVIGLAGFNLLVFLPKAAGEG